MKLNKDERIEDLQCNNLKLIQNKTLYTFTSDSVVLANFIKLKTDDRCVEIGTGSGVISILLSAKTNFDKVYAFEYQEEMAKLAERNVLLNNLREKIEIIFDDVRNFKQHLKDEKFDVVFSNPPYMKESTINQNKVRAIARHDENLPMEDLCKTAKDLLKYNGKFYLVYTATRSAELIACLMKNGLEPKRMFFTENGKGKVILVVIEAVKGGKHGIEVLPNLITNDLKGDYLSLLHTRYVK